ncbi:DUF1810 domain-containing protein [Herbaspirillum sp. LeCh32-8]|uniref:DUF1810 domain-containing protein n=1 Tax=Herbaspirillum sp. LeCh32-8 TaxID=2821356 RepID=UPI001AE5C8EB|nr:DUF1810 domain-containing protein [Herbaspirillum sp. LeCh32-8]MBP0599991.1 DUF1810 domain-containing protein [Herbaspirillum sp. LeCh32-8]
MNDPYSLQRFVGAQAPLFDDVVDELRAGAKRSHWMWFIFPQIAGLGHSDTARHFALRSLGEAQAYLRHPVLGPRLIECTRLVLEMHKTRPQRTLRELFGTPDDLKFHSSMTLFAEAAPEQPEFPAALALYFDAQPDRATLRLLVEKQGVHLDH